VPKERLKMNVNWSYQNILPSNIQTRILQKTAPLAQ
jgi:hypothetical protein